jgi:hypothetical protein
MMKKSSSFFLLFILIGVCALNIAGGARNLSSTVRASVSSVAQPSHSALQEGDAITKANWQQHPKIKQVRAIVRAVNAAMTGKSLTVRRRAFEYCEPYEDTNRTIATDSSGRARYYLNEAGSEDSSLKWQHYYDENGRLRFVLITGGAVNGSKLEHRIYFDESGKRIWEDHTYMKGPGYTFPEVWPDEQLQINDPAAKFSSKSPCPEIKAK